jgi:molybdopterin-guanine dinucleotide biosynthesis protein A
VTPYAAVVIAGGAARRLGGADKPAVLIGGISMLDRVIAAVADAGAIVCVGPQRPTERAVTWTCEAPPGGGPVAALAAGIELVTEPVALVLAADLPFVADAIGPLLQGLPGHDAAVLVDASGRDQRLVGAYDVRALREALTRLGTPAGASMRALLALLRVHRVADQGGPAPAAYDCDTWADVEHARSVAKEHQ